MSRITRLLLCMLLPALALPLLSAAAAPSHRAAAAHPIIGIGDDKPDVLRDPRFLALGVRTVRYDMAWDALAVPAQRAQVVRWMTLAHADGLSVLVTIDHSRRVIYKHVKGKRKPQPFGQSRVMPTTAAYMSAFRAFRARFPWVKDFATWDETNCYCEVSYNQEKAIAGFYDAMRGACSSCTILAAEFLDVPKHYGVPMATWISQFVKILHFQPKYWGLNDYEDANHLVSTSTRLLLSLVRGNVWLAETGGIVNRHNGTHNPGFPQNAAHAALVDSYVLNTLGSLSPRVQRVYLYEWDAQTPLDSWDTALISYTGAPRKGYAVLAKTLLSWGIQPNCAISRVPPTCTGLGGGATGRTGSTGTSAATGTTGTTGATGSSGTTGTTGSTGATS